MIRHHLLKAAPITVAGFRWRGGDVSRLEGFSDAVFGFALTLLVVSLDVPRDFEHLVAAMRGFFAFAACFSILALVWYCHYLFFRRYGLQDAVTIVLNFVLLFVVMFYVYPLKFLFSGLIGMWIGIKPEPGARPAVLPHEFGPLMMIYSGGYVAVHFVFILLYLYAYHRRRELDLNALELFDTKAEIGSLAVLGGIGLFSILLASEGSQPRVMLAGMSYFLISVAMTVYWSLMGSRRRKYEKALVLAVADAPPPRRTIRVRRAAVR
jgi:hypothetical protein